MEVPAVVRGGRVPAKEADKVPAKEGCSSRVQADLTPGKRERGGLRRTKKYEHGGRRRGHDFSTPTVLTEQLRRECNTREQSHQGNYFTDSPKLGTMY